MTNTSLISWVPVTVPSFCERLIGFSVPISNRSLVISYEAVHLLTLGETASVSTDDVAEYDIYDPDTHSAQYQGVVYTIIGLHGGNPLLTSPDGRDLKLDQNRLALEVTSGSTIELSTTYQNFSGDWVAATFSTDGRFILLGCPYDFDFRVWRRSS
ncbi:MAG TPA: hypothetical protein VER96_29065 [Polyangiaceae bacterium]|nr:hypothetical protein [Polyangiaceae bacterium]